MISRARLILLLSALIVAGSAHADPKMDVMLQRGNSDYDSGNYNAALDHWTAALVYGVQEKRNIMYPATYLCAAWYFGHGVEKDLSRAQTACALAAGGHSRFEMQLFQQAMQSNGAPDSTFTFKKALHDGAIALQWYITNNMKDASQ